MAYKIVVIGASAGGMNAIKSLLKLLDKPISVPIIAVQHLSPDADSHLAEILTTSTGVSCFETENKMKVKSGYVYTPAPNYHMYFEKDWCLSLDVGERVSYARPSIDITFESVADALKDEVIGVLLTGANHDGADGLKEIQRLGGLTIVQDPKEAYSSEMPNSALRIMEPDFVLDIKGIAKKINELLISDGE